MLTISVWDIKSIADTVVCGIVALLNLNKRRHLFFWMEERILLCSLLVLTVFDLRSGHDGLLRSCVLYFLSKYIW